MRRRAVMTLTATSALIVAGLSAPSMASAATPRVAIARSTPSWTANATGSSTAAAAALVTFRVYLAPRTGEAALQAAVDSVSNPASASYRKFISSSTYHKTYDPTVSEANAVTKFLKSNKLKVTGIGAYYSYLTVTGTVEDVQKAFGTSIKNYTYAGKPAQANATALTVPKGVSSSILTVTGIDTLPKLNKPASSTPAPLPASFKNARPCSLYYGQVAAKTQADFATPLPKFQGKTLSYAPCGYTGPQLRAAYEGDTDLGGAGVTVGIIDAFASPTIAQDITTYTKAHGDGDYATKQFTQHTLSSYTHTDASETGCDATGWFGEETLDVEAVHAMAPEANIRYFAGKSCYDEDLNDALALAVNENRVDLITNSYGEPDEAESGDGIAAFTNIIFQGSLQGISFLFSSGDNGDELANTALKQTDSSASNPYVTAVGGTSAGIGADGSLLFQAGWGTNKYTLSANGKTWSPLGYLYGAGGGYSTLFNRPSYQNGVISSGAPAGRAVPDVALDADPNTGMLIGETQEQPDGTNAYSEYRIGGTSLSSPLFAGTTALLLEHAKGRLGFLNPLIYGQARAKAGTFTDVKPTGSPAGDVRVDYANGNDAADGLLYSVRTFGQDSSLTVTKGWDQVTGVGTPNTKWLTSVAPLG